MALIKQTRLRTPSPGTFSRQKIMNTWRVNHIHQHWTDTEVVFCEVEPTEDDVVKALDLDYNVHHGERIEITEINPITIIK